jgi:ATP-dependent Clp protease ATP-binding subunit ClpC
MDDAGKSKESARQAVKDFTSEAKERLTCAYKEAAALKHGCVETEHLLMAIIDSNQSLATKVLIGKGIDLETLRLQLVAQANARSSAKQAAGSLFGGLLSSAISGLSSMLSPPGRLPFSLRVKKVLALALREAADLGHSRAGTEHILLGLIREQDGHVAHLLKKPGLEIESLRKLIASQPADPQKP